MSSLVEPPAPAPEQAALPHCARWYRPPPQVGWLFYTTFVRTMRREWLGIDRLRLDKFMMLIRKFFAASLRQLQAHDWWVAGSGSQRARPGWSQPLAVS